jgi:hypothetical protein
LKLNKGISIAEDGLYKTGNSYYKELDLDTTLDLMKEKNNKLRLSKK